MKKPGFLPNLRVTTRLFVHQTRFLSPMRPGLFYSGRRARMGASQCCRIYLQKWDAAAQIGLKLIGTGLKPSLQTRIHIVCSQDFFPNLKS